VIDVYSVEPVDNETLIAVPDATDGRIAVVDLLDSRRSRQA
jgi:hypothetical protein